MPPGRLLLEVSSARPTVRRPQGTPGTRWRDSTAHLAYECLGYQRGSRRLSLTTRTSAFPDSLSYHLSQFLQEKTHISRHLMVEKNSQLYFKQFHLCIYLINRCKKRNRCDTNRNTTLLFLLPRSCQHPATLKRSGPTLHMPQSTTPSMSDRC